MATVVGDLVVKLRGDITQFNKAMTTATARLKKMGAQMTAVGRGISMGLSLPLAAVGIAATKLATDFNLALSRVVGLVGRTKEEVAAWREEILRLGPTVGIASKELGEALFFVTSAGIRGAAVMETVQAAAQAAAAGMGDTAVVADAVTSAMNAYAGANIDAELATATLVATVREGKAEASSLAPVLGRILPVAASLGVSFDQVGGAMAAMTRLGFDAATSATALRATMVQLIKTTPKQEKAAASLGLSLDNVRRVIREDGLLAGLQMIKDAVGENEQAMVGIFPNVRALSGVLAMMGDSAEATTEIFARMAKTTKDDLRKALEAAEAEAGTKFKKALVAIQNLLIRIGDDILPMLVPEVEKLTVKMQEWANTWRELSPGMKEFILKASALTIAIGPLLLVLGTVTTALASLAQAVKWVVAGFASMTGITTVTSAVSGAGAAATTAAGGVTALEVSLAAANKAAILAGVKVVALTAGVAALGLAIGVGIGTWMQGYIEKWEWVAKIIGTVADKHKDLAAGLAENEDAYDSAYSATSRMIAQLKLEGDQWKLNSEFTKENAQRLSEITDKVIELAKEKSKQKRQFADALAASDQAAATELRNAEAVAKAIDEETAAELAHLDALKEKYDVLDKDDIAEQMEAIGQDLVAMKDTVDKTQLAEKFNEPMLELAKLAAENKVEFPKPFKDAADVLGDKLAPGMQKLIDLSFKFANDFTNTGKEIEGIFWSTGQAAEASLSGGFATGIKKGIDEGGVHMQDFVQRLEDTIIYIPVQPNLEGWNQAVEDAQAGRIPDTTG